MAKAKDAFLNELIDNLRSQFSKTQIQIRGPDQPMGWPGQPKNLWPKADAVFEIPNVSFILESDEDSDPGRSLIKYWPYFDAHEDESPIVYIGVWKKGGTIGQGYFKLAKFIAKKFARIYPRFDYHLIQRTNEWGTAEQVAERIFKIVRQERANQESNPK